MFSKRKMTVLICVCVLILNLVVLFIALTYTTQMKSLLEIPILLNNKTFIKDEQDLLEKINKLVQGGHEHLQIVTDFDQTLTADPLDGRIVLNSYEMLRLCPSIPQMYKEKDKQLYYKYKHIEEDPNISLEIKSKNMLEWYKESDDLLRGIKYPRNEMEALALNSSGAFRENVNLLMQWSEANNVPIIVISSGLGDAVVASLKAANLFTPNVKVISNFLALDKDDIITGTKGDPIHSYNKNEASLRNIDYYRTVKERNNVILMGDSLGDTNMTYGIEYLSNVIKIGFLSKKKANYLQNYMNNFDIVLENDQTMNVVNAIINLL